MLQPYKSPLTVWSELERVESLGREMRETVVLWPGDLPHKIWEEEGGTLPEGYEWDLGDKGPGRRLMRVIYVEDGVTVLGRDYLLTDYPMTEVEDD